MRPRMRSRGRSRPASIIPSIAAATASSFIFMKSTSVLSRSNTMARITNAALRGGPSLDRGSDRAPEADLAVVDAEVEAARRIAAHPGLVVDRRAVAPVVRQGQQHPVVT